MGLKTGQHPGRVACLHSAGAVYWKSSMHSLRHKVKSHLDRIECIEGWGYRSAAHSCLSSNLGGLPVAKQRKASGYRSEPPPWTVQQCRALAYVSKLANRTKCGNSGQSQLRPSHLGIHIADHLLHWFWRLLVVRLLENSTWQIKRWATGQPSTRAPCFFLRRTRIMPVARLNQT